jgi:lysophospholipid acyltransferase (LPLAT)-like uncharacterized protein
MKKLLFNYILPAILYVLVHLWCMTIRSKNLNPEAEAFFQNLQGKYILTLWHSRIFYLFYYFRGRPDLTLLISPSQDGDLLASLARFTGYTVVRGSTYKQTFSGTRSLIKTLKNGGHVIIIADGSRGPRHKAQIGSIQLARISGAPVIPMTYDGERKYEFNSWDRFVLPLPFTRCAINFAPPITLPYDSEELRMQTLQQELEDALIRITDECGGPLKVA